MDDLISRQQAIDVLNSFDVLDGHTDKEEIKERIEQLPPAEPTSSKMEQVPTRCNLIDRQAVIDALNHELRCGAVINQCGLEVAYEVIEGLPPAEPKIIRCKDCKHWIPYDWMFSAMWQSKNIDDYPEDDIGCDCSEMAMKANDFCSRAERRTE